MCCATMRLITATETAQTSVHQDWLEAQGLRSLLFTRQLQRLKAAHVAAQAHVDKAPSPNAYRITVGRSGSIFFEVAAEGDNWQQVVDAVSAKA